MTNVKSYKKNSINYEMKKGGLYVSPPLSEYYFTVISAPFLLKGIAYRCAKVAGIKP